MPRKLLLVAVMLGILGLVLFGSAGRLDLPFFWAHLAITATVFTLAYWFIPPDLVKERLKPGAGGTDRNLRKLVMPFFLAHLVIAGLDVGRFQWSADMPAALQVAGLIGFTAAFSLSVWAVSVNRFFSPVVRIQSERGHHLVTAGPYRFIRHPGYAASLLILPCAALALGSWWSMVPLLPVAFLLFRRTIVEDRFLHQNLPGYSDYAQRVRYRLVPAVW